MSELIDTGIVCNKRRMLISTVDRHVDEKEVAAFLARSITGGDLLVMYVGLLRDQKAKNL